MAMRSRNVSLGADPIHRNAVCLLPQGPFRSLLSDPSLNETFHGCPRARQTKKRPRGRPRGRLPIRPRWSSALVCGLLQALDLGGDIGDALRRLLHINGADVALGGLDGLLE